ncbi:MAG: diguanylate cyclase [Planctomycetota bacterium]
MREPSSIIGQLRVLVMSTDSDCRSMVRAALGREPLLEYRFAECERLDAAKAILAHHEFDLIILDTNVEDVRWLANLRTGATIVFLARGAGASSLDEVVAAGATDYFSQDEYQDSPAMLWVVLRQSIRYHAIAQQRRHLTQALRDRDSQVVHLTQRLWRAAPYDYRTGWFSHGQILERLSEEMSRSRRYKLPFTVVLTEFEGLGEQGSIHGQSFADQLMTQLATRMRQVTRQTDVVGHYGVDAALILLTNTESLGGVRFCERIAEVLADPVAIDVHKVRVGWYSGLSQHDLAIGQKPEDLLRIAEDRLEQAKRKEVVGTVVTD